MIHRLSDREDVDKDHVITLNGENARLYFLKQNSKTDVFKIVEELLLDSYESRTQANYL